MHIHIHRAKVTPLCTALTDLRAIFSYFLYCGGHASFKANVYFSINTFSAHELEVDQIDLCKVLNTKIISQG